MKNMIQVQELSVGYQEPILKNLSFSVEAGEILVILGTNGIGKSTLMRTLTGLLEPLFGKFSLHALKIGLMPQLQTIQQDLPMTVSDFLNLFEPIQPDWLDYLIKILELEDLLRLPLTQLSCGMWQRVNLAQALSTEPDLLFLDEPTQGLDLRWQTQFYEILDDYAKEHRAAVICISHDVLAVSKYADKVLCLDHQPTHDEILQKRTQHEADFVIYTHQHLCCGGHL